jgi:antitoxin component of RelBE/YafQ-DinJ toxin-antitoxin module
MISIDPSILKKAQAKCQAKGMKLSAVIEIWLRDEFLTQK